MRSLAPLTCAAIFLAAATWSLAPGQPWTFILQGIAIVLVIATFGRMPAPLREQMFRDFRIELWVFAAVCLTLLALAFESLLPARFHGALVILWATFAFGLLAMLIVRIARMVSMGLRRAGSARS